VSAPLPACEWDDITPVPVSVPGARLRLRALVAIGHGPRRIAAALGGVSTHAVQRILTGETTVINDRQLSRIRDLYEAWWNLAPPERTRGERVTATAARRRAREAGWCTAIGLDDDLLDEPGYEPHCAWRPATGTGVATDSPLREVSPHMTRRLGLGGSPGPGLGLPTVEEPQTLHTTVQPPRRAP
jgi:hypothetical protein